MFSMSKSGNVLPVRPAAPIKPAACIAAAISKCWSRLPPTPCQSSVTRYVDVDVAGDGLGLTCFFLHVSSRGQRVDGRVAGLHDGSAHRLDVVFRHVECEDQSFLMRSMPQSAYWPYTESSQGWAAGWLMLIAHHLLSQLHAVVAIWSTVYFVPRIGALLAMTSSETEPRRVWIPTLSPIACILSANGSNPLPPALLGHLESSGCGRSFASRQPDLTAQSFLYQNSSMVRTSNPAATMPVRIIVSATAVAPVSFRLP